MQGSQKKRKSKVWMKRRHSPKTSSVHASLLQESRRKESRGRDTFRWVQCSILSRGFLNQEKEEEEGDGTKLHSRIRLHP